MGRLIVLCSINRVNTTPTAEKSTSKEEHTLKDTTRQTLQSLGESNTSSRSLGNEDGNLWRAEDGRKSERQSVMGCIRVQNLPLTERNSRLTLGLMRKRNSQRNLIQGQVRCRTPVQQTD